MTTDMERELRELFREKAGEAPIATFGTSAAAPQEVLRRGRRRQVGTVLGSAAIVLVLIVGSVAGLNAVLRGEERPVHDRGLRGLRTNRHDRGVHGHEPSDWYLVNEWPLSMLIAVRDREIARAMHGCCAGCGQPSPVCTSSEPSLQSNRFPTACRCSSSRTSTWVWTQFRCGQDLPARRGRPLRGARLRASDLRGEGPVDPGVPDRSGLPARRRRPVRTGSVRQLHGER